MMPPASATGLRADSHAGRARDRPLTRRKRPRWRAPSNDFRLCYGHAFNALFCAHTLARRFMYHGERFNSLTHLAGLVLAVAGAAVLITRAALAGDAWQVVSFSIFASTMVLLYGASTVYHSVRGSLKNFFVKCDHCAIYLLIAGTYTPFTLVTLRGPWGWALFGTVWGLAAIGIVKELWLGRDRVPSVPLYVAMGWLGVIAAVPLVHNLPGAALAWLVAGGLFYTVGIVFYANDTRWRHAHGVWHLFVLAGTACHYLTILFFVE
jgi:hemolysin III